MYSPLSLFYGFLPPVVIMYTHNVQKASCSRPTSYNLNSKKRGWWTEEQGKKVEVSLGRLEEIIRIAVNLQDMQRKEYKKQNKTKWDIKNGEKQCNKLDLL